MKNDLVSKKMELFIKYSERGILLLTVNEWKKFKMLRRMLTEWLHPIFYDMGNTEYSSILRDFSSMDMEEKKSVVFENFDLPQERLNDLLERFNLGRDLLLKKTKYCVFVVPLYVEIYIQEKFPNLYSYFEFKEQYLTEYINYCEFILPEDGYLNTKSMQRTLKQTLTNQNNDLVQKLDGYLYVHISEMEFENLEKTVYEYVEEIEKDSKSLTKELQDTNSMFCCRLMVSLARVATLQANYDKAIEIYIKVSSYEKVKNHPKIVFEILNGVADTYLYAENYDKAYENYSNILNFVTERFNDDEQKEEDFLDIKIRIYSKLALCEFNRGNLERVEQFLELTKLHLKKVEKKEFFPVYYNYLLMYLDIYPDNSQEAENLLKMLESFSDNDMQKAMFLTIKAWYDGIINGKLSEALKMSNEALKIKRNLYIENDARIAESHYINAMIYLFKGEYQESKYCCIKSMNILKNFHFRTYQKEKSAQLLKKIAASEEADLHNTP